MKIKKAILMERDLKLERRRVFVIDGSKALGAGINHLYGSRIPVQLYRNPKVLNLLDYLLEDRKMDVETAMKGAFVLKADESMLKLGKLAE